VIECSFSRQAGIDASQVYLQNQLLSDNLLPEIQSGRIYRLRVLLPL
jgi:hypothetical protein